MWAMGSSINRSMTGREWALLLTLSLVWGGSFFFNGIAVRELPTFTVVVCRVMLAALILLVVMRALRLKMPTDQRGVGGLLRHGLP